MQRTSRIFLVGTVLVCASIAAAEQAGVDSGADLALLEAAAVGGIYEGQLVQLTDGVYEGPPYVEGGAARPRVVLLREMYARGELGGPTGEELVGLFSETSGGSGERIYVAAFGTAGGSAVNFGTALVGDRAKLRSLDIRDGLIFIDVVEAGPEQPMCCGTQLARKSYRLEADGLRLVASDVTGQLSIATWSGTEWSLVEMNGQALPAGSKAPTLQFQDGQVAGFGGCNRYTGPVKEPEPGVVSIGNMAVTMMACVPPQGDIEASYLKQLAGVRGYTFLAGRLALRWEVGDETGWLMFARP